MNVRIMGVYVYTYIRCNIAWIIQLVFRLRQRRYGCTRGMCKNSNLSSDYFFADGVWCVVNLDLEVLNFEVDEVCVLFFLSFSVRGCGMSYMEN